MIILEGLTAVRRTAPAFPNVIKKLINNEINQNPNFIE